MPGEYEVPYIDQANAGTNMLVGVMRDTRLASTMGGYSNFVLTQENTGKLFTSANNTMLSIGSAYLRIATSNLLSGTNKITPRFEQEIKGDVNSDGKVDITDAVLIINRILGHSVSSFNFFTADTNDDGTININDAVQIVSIILSK